MSKPSAHAQSLQNKYVRALPTLGWKSTGVLALLCSGVAWASLARASDPPPNEERQWQALEVAPLSNGGGTGMPMVSTAAVQPVGFVPHRSVRMEQAQAAPPTVDTKRYEPVRIQGRAGDGLYWAIRAAGASPQVSADYLAALATQIDVGEIGPADTFDMVIGANGALLYAGLERVGAPKLQLVRWTDGGNSQWVDAANVAQQVAQPASGLAMPAAGPITSYFGYRYHPILHFTRFHAGVDIGAGWGSPIVAAADGRIITAGWSGGFGRKVEIAHTDGMTSIYGHMSEIVAQPGTFVHAGQLIGYVGSSGLSTGPHLHFEVRQGGTPVNPLAVRFPREHRIDAHLADAVKSRLNALLNLAAKRT